MDEAESPAQRATRAQAERARGIVEMRRAVGRASRVNAETLLRTAIYIVRIRQIGKTAFVLTLDVGRRCARVLGEQLVADGRADDVDDIFYLTLDEATDGVIGDVRELVAFRRDRRAHYKQLTVPEMFDGTPGPIALSTNDIRAGDKVEALGVGAPVTVEGRVRLVLDPSQCDEPLGSGEVLVTTTTDPSWASMFATACALVIDVGGAVSHGAIVARELGIPCAINTKTGTRTFRDGDMVRVDGIAGTVELLVRRS
jgi:pyruvate,water dikinase